MHYLIINCLANQDRVSLSQMVVYLFYLHTCLTDAMSHVLGVIHFRVAVGNGGEVKARHGEAEGSRLEALTVPQRFHDKQSRVGGHGLSRPAQYAYDFVHAEAVEKLAHPNGV